MIPNQTKGIVVCVFAICLGLFLLMSLSISGEDTGTRANTATYVGTEDCKLCHADTYEEWNETYHGIDFANWDYHGTPTNKYTMYGGGCVSCHVVGYNDLDHGGYNPAYAWNSTENVDLLGIGCENCHGPGSAHKTSLSADDINLDIDPYTSCGGTADAECHGGTRQWGTDTIPGWNTSAHAPWDNPADDSGFNTYCARCKSPSQWDPAATRTTADPIAPEDYKGITCGDCHDSHNDTGYYAQLKWEPEDSCDACHNGGHHETMRTETLGGTPSVPIADYPYMEDVACVECHMWSTPHGTPEDFAVVGHSFESSLESCVDCHTDVYDNMPDSDYDDYDTNATIEAEWDAWEAELDAAYEEWSEVVEAGQERNDALLEEVNHLVEEVEELMEVAEGNGTWTTEMEHMWEQAEYDWELGDHASRGAHNPAYAIALLNAAKENLTDIIDELHDGKLTGTVTDSAANALSGVFVSVNGHGTKTAADGTYSIMLVPGTYAVTAYKEGTIDQSATGVVLKSAAVVVRNFTLANDLDKDGTPDTTDTDADNDGMLDTWETDNGLDPTDPADAFADPDGDGLINLQEYTDDTDPQVKAAVVEPEEIGDFDLNLLSYILLIVITVLIIVVALKGGKKGKTPAMDDGAEPEAPTTPKTPMGSDEKTV